MGSLVSDRACRGLAPDMRGGHQMMIDSERGKLFLLSGWNGRQDLGDLWEYHIPHQTWRCVQRDTHAEG